MSWQPIALTAPWRPTAAQLRRVCQLAELGRSSVYTIPAGSLIVFAHAPSGDARWIEVIPPEPDYVIAYDTGAR